jgi:LPS-assembly lipoprotein
LARIAPALCAALLLAGCFEPLYGTRPSIDGEAMRDKLSSVEIARIPAPQGVPESRLAVALQNALTFEFNGGHGPSAPTHRLEIGLSTTQMSVIVDVTSGRANAQVDSVVTSFSLTEIATGKRVVSDTTFARVSYDIPGSAQRFAKQRAQRDAEDRAIGIIADNIRNRLASYFVAGT